MKFLEGYKTKIGLIIIFVLGGLKAVGVLDDEAFNLLVPFAVTLTGYGIYDRIGRKK